MPTGAIDYSFLSGVLGLLAAVASLACQVSRSSTMKGSMQGTSWYRCLMSAIPTFALSSTANWCGSCAERCSVLHHSPCLLLLHCNSGGHVSYVVRSMCQSLNLTVVTSRLVIGLCHCRLIETNVFDFDHEKVMGYDTDFVPRPWAEDRPGGSFSIDFLTTAMFHVEAVACKHCRFHALPGHFDKDFAVLHHRWEHEVPLACGLCSLFFLLCGSSIEHSIEIFHLQIGLMDQFGWFMDFLWCSSRAQRDASHSPADVVAGVVAATTSQP